MSIYEKPKQVRAENGAEDEAEHDEEATAGEAQQNQILQTGSISAVKGKHVIHCLTIIGQVEGHYILPAQNKTTKYEHVIPQLVAIEQDPEIEGLVIILNTVGGDVEAGLAIAELIAGMKKPTVSLVLGGGHSIGVPLACSAKYSLIAPSATMTIHPVRMNGLVLGVPQTLSYFDKMQERIVRFVTGNSRINAKRFRELMMNTGEMVMDVGSVLDGEAAVREGLIDELGGLARVVEKLYELIEQRAMSAEKPERAMPAEKPERAMPAEKPEKARKGRKPANREATSDERAMPAEKPEKARKGRKPANREATSDERQIPAEKPERAMPAEKPEKPRKGRKPANREATSDERAMPAEKPEKARKGRKPINREAGGESPAIKPEKPRRGRPPLNREATLQGGERT